MSDTMNPYGCKTVSLAEFINHESESYDEYIRIIPDRESRQLALFRKVKDSFEDSDMVRTVIDNVRIRLTQYDLEFSDIDRIHLHHSKADTLLTFLNSLKWDMSRSEANVSLEYIPINNSENLDKSGLNQESLLLTYQTESGKERLVDISQTYKHESTRMADLS